MYTIEQLKAKTKQKGWTYADLASVSGVPEGSLKNLFSGRVPTPRYDTICAIVSALGLDDDAPDAQTPDIVRVYDALTPRGQTLLMGYGEGLLAAEGKELTVVLSVPATAQKIGQN